MIENLPQRCWTGEGSRRCSRSQRDLPVSTCSCRTDGPDRHVSLLENEADRGTWINDRRAVHAPKSGRAGSGRLFPRSSFPGGLQCRLIERGRRGAGRRRAAWSSCGTGARSRRGSSAVREHVRRNPLRLGHGRPSACRQYLPFGAASRSTPVFTMYSAPSSSSPARASGDHGIILRPSGNAGRPTTSKACARRNRRDGCRCAVARGRACQDSMNPAVPGPAPRRVSHGPANAHDRNHAQSAFLAGCRRV